MTSAIVLAAGSSTRMGENNKLTLPYLNSTILETVVNQIQQSKVDEIILVLGHEQEKIKELFIENQRIHFCYNSRHLSGMTTSIQTGIQSTAKDTNGYLICLSDMPFLDKNDYNKILQATTQKKEILIPFINQQKGNPVYFSKHFKPNILAHQAMNGCKEIVMANKNFVRKIFFKNNHILKDIDTQKDYSSITP